MFIEGFNCLDTIAGFQHCVPARNEPARIERAQAFFILDEQDRPLPGKVSGGGARQRVSGRQRTGNGWRFGRWDLCQRFFSSGNMTREEYTERGATRL